MTISLIGTSHSVQVWTDAKRNDKSLDVPLKAITAFECFVFDAVVELGIELLAEEASEEWVADHGPDAVSVAKGIAKRAGSKHVFCDPDRTQRRRLGFPTSQVIDSLVNEEEDQHASYCNIVRAGFPAREAFWLCRLKEARVNAEEVLFICGADHIDTFSIRLKEDGEEVRVLCADWMVDHFDKFNESAMT